MTARALPLPAEPANDDASDVLTVPEAAAYLRLNPKTLYKLIDEGRVPYVRIGERRIRMRRSSLVAWLAGQERAPRRDTR
jgi:excisionase family DNA binding protein